MENLKRKDSETDFEYKIRLCNAKLDKEIDLDWIELVQLLGLSCSSDHLRKLAYGYKECNEYINNIKENGITEAEVLKEIEDKRKGLEKEKVRFQDQKREYMSLLRTDARFEHLVDEMRKSIEKLNTTNPLVNKYEGVFDNEESTEAVLILSDWHFGIKEENYWNKIDINIAKERVDKLKEYAIKYCKRHNVKTLHVEILGDMINGLIHLGTRISNEEDVMDQAMHCAELVCQFLNKLSSDIPNIKVYSATGNHGRCSANIKDSLDTENFERMIPWYIDGRLKNNVELMDNIYEKDIIIYKFLNETIFAVHGHNDKVKSAVDDLSDMFKMFPTELHMGHYHSYQEFDSHSMVTTVNGTLSGVDKFAKSIRKTSQPVQVLAIYNEDGRECTYKIKL